jgi:hypothetical protein
MIARSPKFTIFAATFISLAASCKRAAASTSARSTQRDESTRRSGRLGR